MTYRPLLERGVCVSNASFGECAMALCMQRYRSKHTRTHAHTLRPLFVLLLQSAQRVGGRVDTALVALSARTGCWLP